MSEERDIAPSEQRRLQRRGRIQGAAIMAIILLPLVAAHLIYYTGVGLPDSRVNRGDLIDPPLPAAELHLSQPGLGNWHPQEQSPRWRLLIPGQGRCDRVCQQNLYLTRQVSIRLADDSQRVARYYLLLDERLDAQTAAWLSDEHPGVQVLRTTERALAATGFDASPDGEGRYFLMDPGGFVMMAYSPDHSGGELLDDLKRMLKFSQER